MIPLVDVGALLASGVGVIIGGWGGVVLVMLAPVEDFGKDSGVDLIAGAWEFSTVESWNIFPRCCDGRWRWGKWKVGEGVRKVSVH